MGNYNKSERAVFRAAWAVVVVFMFQFDSLAEDVGGKDSAQSEPLGAVKRDPFWPVGYIPEKLKVEPVKEVKVLTGGAGWKNAMKQVAIQGVSSRSGGGFYAVINGKIKSIGETVTVKIGQVSYTWVIDEISPPSSVKLRRVSTQ